MQALAGLQTALNELDKRGVTEDDPRRLLLQRLLVTEQGQDEDGGGASPSASGPKLPAALSARLVKGLNDAETGCIRAQVLAFRYLSRGLRLPEQVRYNLAQQVENHSHYLSSTNTWYASRRKGPDMPGYGLSSSTDLTTLALEQNQRVRARMEYRMLELSCTSH